MKKIDLEGMSIEGLWTLHEKVSELLSTRITSEKHELERRLAYLNRGTNAIMQGPEPVPNNGGGKSRRTYPRVLPDPSTATHRHRTRHGPGGESSPVGSSRP